jgi:hypothetical protein
MPIGESVGLPAEESQPVEEVAHPEFPTVLAQPSSGGLEAWREFRPGWAAGH